jgi:RNA polymerase sigma factor (sigma-70 family)
MKEVSDEQTLIHDCLSGNPDSQRKLFERYYPILMSICRRYASNTDEAKDLLQEGFIKIFDNIHKFRGESSFKTWITRIVINNAINHLNKEKKKLFTPLDDNFDTQDESDDLEDSIPFEPELVLTLIQQLPPGYRSIINLYGVEGYSHKQIGELLGISEGTSKSQLAKARKLLKQLLTKHKQDAT